MRNSKRLIAITTACLMLSGCGNGSVESVSSSESNSIPTVIVKSEYTPQKYTKMQDSIELVLKNHNDVTQSYNYVKVSSNNGLVTFEIETQAYETFSFTAIVNIATEEIGRLIEEYEVTDYEVRIHSPYDAERCLVWNVYNSGNLEQGYFTDSGNNPYDGPISLEDLANRYGYEDYRGRISDHISQSVSN